MREGAIVVGDLAVSYLEDGPADGPLALCLHGFPDSAWTWRHLLPALADAGFRAVAPWMRGYAPTGVPIDGLYGAHTLGEEANRFHAAFSGDERAVLIGHDWGAQAACTAAGSAPERWVRVVTEAFPPLSSMAAGFLTYEQLRRSWYVFFFQMPLAELALPMDDFALVDRLWRDWSPGYDAADDLAHAKDALRTPENLAAALGYYRAMFDPRQAGGPVVPPPQPWLYLHGRDDGCLGVDLAPDDAVLIEGAGHFAHLERPDEFNAHVLKFLT